MKKAFSSLLVGAVLLTLLGSAIVTNAETVGPSSSMTTDQSGWVTMPVTHCTNIDGGVRVKPHIGSDYELKNGEKEINGGKKYVTYSCLSDSSYLISWQPVDVTIVSCATVKASIDGMYAVCKKSLMIHAATGLTVRPMRVSEQSVWLKVGGDQSGVLEIDKNATKRIFLQKSENRFVEVTYFGLDYQGRVMLGIEDNYKKPLVVPSIDPSVENLGPIEVSPELVTNECQNLSGGDSTYGVCASRSIHHESGMIITPQIITDDAVTIRFMKNDEVLIRQIERAEMEAIPVFGKAKTYLLVKYEGKTPANTAKLIVITATVK